MYFNYFSPNEVDYDDYYRSTFDYYQDQSFNYHSYPVRQQPGFPGFPGGGFPTTPPPLTGGGQQQGAPLSPPPSFTPSAPSASVFAVDPGAIRGCLFRNTYVWLNNGDSFWFFPTFVGRQSVAGFRWSRFGWVYFGIDLRRIRSFQCF